MKLLLDENAPVQLIAPLRQILPGHVVHHVNNIHWRSKKDRVLIPDAAAKGYDALVTQDGNQLSDPDECDLLKKARIHHIRFSRARWAP